MSSAHDVYGAAPCVGVHVRGSGVWGNRATSYLLGVSTRRVEKLAASLGVVGLSKSQVSAMASELDEFVDGFRNRPVDRGPYMFVWIDALT